MSVPGQIQLSCIHSVQGGTYALRKVHMRSIPFLRSFSSVALETVPVLLSMAFTLSHTLTSTSGTISPKTSGECYSLFLQKQTKDISLLRIFQLSNTVLHPHQPIQYVYVCVCACACVHAFVCVCHVCVCVRRMSVCVCTLHIVMLEPLLMSTGPKFKFNLT